MINKMSNPFEIPNIVHEKIQLEEILEILQSTTNISYMPTSSNVVKSNSKPHYSKSANLQFPEFPNIENAQAGFYIFDECHYTLTLLTKVPNKHLFKYIALKNVDILVNLHTLETIVLVNNVPFSKWYSWLPGPDYAIAIDNYVFDTEVI